MSCFAGRQNSVVTRPTEMSLGFVVESWAWEDRGGQDPLTYTISVPYPAKRVEVGILVRRLTVPYVVRRNGVHLTPYFATRENLVVNQSRNEGDQPRQARQSSPWPVATRGS